MREGAQDVAADQMSRLLRRKHGSCGRCSPLEILELERNSLARSSGDKWPNCPVCVRRDVLRSTIIGMKGCYGIRQEEVVAPTDRPDHI